MLVQYTNDSMVDPYQSSQFGEFDQDGNMRTIHETELYMNDKIGIKTLDEQNKISYMTILGTPFHSHLNNSWKVTVIFLDFLYNKDHTFGKFVQDSEVKKFAADRCIGCLEFVLED
jgi:hypothetical protein